MQYKKLIRLKATGFFSYGSLWLGPDHLLLIESRRISEDYKRFYFKDIQAIVTRKTSRSRILNYIFGSSATFCGVLLIGTGGSWTAAGFSLFFVMLLGINLLLSPTCQCHIQTAVQSAKLAPIKRLRTARRIIAKLKPFIETKQGQLNTEKIPEEMPVNDFESPKSAVGLQQTTRRTPTTQFHEKGLFFQILFALLLVSAVFMALEFISTNAFLSLIEGLVELAIFIFSVICVVRLSIGNVRGPLRPLAWTTLGFNIIRFVSGYAMMMYYFFIGKINPNNNWEMIQFFSQLSPYDSPFLMGYLLFFLVGSGVLGMLGFLFVKQQQVKPQKLQADFNSRNGTVRV